MGCNLFEKPSTTNGPSRLAFILPSASGNYSKEIGPGTFTAGGNLRPDGTYDTEARYGISFANGGLASIL